jgi:hypothetical protein
VTATYRSRIYIAGPMTGLPEYNRAAFLAAASRITTAGYDCFSPTSLWQQALVEHPWEHWLRLGLRELTYCDSIYMLQGWNNSRGAVLEWKLAHELGYNLYFEGTHFLEGTQQLDLSL